MPRLTAIEIAWNIKDVDLGFLVIPAIVLPISVINLWPFKIFSTLLFRGCETPQPVSFYIAEAAAVALSSKEERAEQRKT